MTCLDRTVSCPAVIMCPLKDAAPETQLLIPNFSSPSRGDVYFYTIPLKMNINDQIKGLDGEWTPNSLSDKCLLNRNHLGRNKRDLSCGLLPVSSSISHGYSAPCRSIPRPRPPSSGSLRAAILCSHFLTGFLFRQTWGQFECGTVWEKLPVPTAPSRLQNQPTRRRQTARASEGRRSRTPSASLVPDILVKSREDWERVGVGSWLPQHCTYDNVNN